MPHPIPTSCRWLLGLLLPVTLSAAVETLPLPVLPHGARVGIWGDSITEQRIYSVYTEAYLLACAGRTDVTCCVFGHDGETLGALLSRQVDLESFKPTVVTFNYGMNDARDSIPWRDECGGTYGKTLDDILAMLATRGIQPVIVGPGHATPPGRTKPADAAGVDHLRQRNIALAHFRDIGFEAARKTGLPYADINRRMADVLEQGKRVDPGYSFLDIHAAPNGHLAMAHELLKALGCDGSIGSITIDLKGKATATTGHTVVSDIGGVAVIDSMRYPFCCEYDQNARGQDGSLSSVLPFLPFQQELNRLMLTVAHLEAEAADITWGGVTKRFTKAQLAAGINLPQEFPRTPFDDQFARLIGAVRAKQDYEQFMIKGTSNFFGNAAGGNIDANMLAVAARHDARVKTMLVPVRHVIAVMPVGADPIPAFVGSLTAFGMAGQQFRYDPSVIGKLTGFTANGLPDGLHIDPVSGIIGGIPGAAGTAQVTIASGPVTATLTIVIDQAAPRAPVITSAKTATATVGVPFSYRIEAGNAPEGCFAWRISGAGTPPTASSLPVGFSYDPRTGVISGVPTVAGICTLSIAAWNDGGVGTGTVEITTAASVPTH